MELKKYKLADIGKVITGKTPSTSIAENYAWGTIPFYTPEDVAKGLGMMGRNSRFISKTGFEEIASNTILGESVLVGCIGSDMGNVAYSNITCATNQQINAITQFKNGIDPLYVYYLLSTMKSYFQKIAGSTTTPILPKSVFEEIEIHLPDMKKQKDVVSILYALDRKIELNKLINDNLEAMAKQLYDYWFVQFDFPNEEGKPYKSSGGAMVWNEKLKREIPSCFEVDNMGNLCNFRNGINYSKDEIGNDYQIVNVRNISSSRILLDGEDFDVITVPTSKAENYVLKPDDIIIARSGCPGSTRLLLLPANTLFCGFIICCSPHNSSMRNYLTYCLKQLEGTNATTSGGSILQNVSQDTLKGLQIIVPEKEIIDKFNKTIEFIFARMLNCLKESKTLTKQRDELLPLLMNGQASVNYHLSDD